MGAFACNSAMQSDHLKCGSLSIVEIETVGLCFSCRAVLTLHQE